MGEKLKSLIKEEKFSLKIAQTGHNTCIDYKDYISGGGGRRETKVISGTDESWSTLPLGTLPSNGSAE